ncbi:MAG: TonB-dependent receptor [Bacteroidota bacterium]
MASKTNFRQKPIFKTLFLLTALPLLFTVSSHGQIQGRCLDAQTGQPVQDAEIQNQDRTMAKTNRSGQFSFESNSSITVTIIHPGYDSMSGEVEPGDDNLFLLNPSDRELDEVTVSAPLLNYQSKKVPAGFSVIPPDTLHPSLEAIDIIEQSPGVIMQKGARNTGRITIRGIGSRSPYATTRVRAYIDDIPLTSGDGHTTIEDLEMYNIARTEVVRGPSSALYGSGMGGTIVFHPDHTQSSPLSVDGLIQYGPFDQKKGLISAGTKKERSILKTTASHVKTSGFRENNDYERTNGQVMFRQHFSNHSLFFLANYIHLDAQIPSSLDEETYQQSPGNAAENWLGVEGFEEYDKWLSGVTLKSQLTENFDNKLSVFLNHINSYESRPFNILDDQMLTYGLRNEATIFTGPMEITAGAEIFNEQYDWQLKETQDGTEGAKFADNHETRRYINVFGKTDIPLFPGWELSAGANLHFLKFELEDNFEDEENLSGEYQYDPVFSPRIGLTGELNDNMTLFASAGHGFSAPSVEETLLPEGSINPDLKPEEGYNYDLGIRGELFRNRVHFDVTGYYISLENLLVTKRESEEIFYGINAGESAHKGIETMLKTRMLPPSSPYGLDLNITHTLMNNEFKTFVDEGTDHSDNELPGVPDQHLRASLKGGIPPYANLKLEWVHSGSMQLNDENTKQYPGHHIFNLKATSNIKSGNHVKWEVQGGIQNLFDRHYAAMILPNAPSFGPTDPRYYYPGAPRNAYIRLIVKFRE